MKTIICRDCEQPFEHVNLHRFRCDHCYQIARREQYRLSSERRRRAAGAKKQQGKQTTRKLIPFAGYDRSETW